MLEVLVMAMGFFPEVVGAKVGDHQTGNTLANRSHIKCIECVIEDNKDPVMVWMEQPSSCINGVESSPARIKVIKGSDIWKDLDHARKFTSNISCS